MQIRKDINHLRQLLDETTCDEEAKCLVARIDEEILEGNIIGIFPISSGMDPVYSEKIIKRPKS